MFLSDVDYVKAPPFASFYLDENKEIYSDNSDKVKQIFAQNNFFSFFNEEPANSLINELLFISFLIKKQDDIILQTLKEEFLLGLICGVLMFIINQNLIFTKL